MKNQPPIFKHRYFSWDKFLHSSNDLQTWVGSDLRSGETVIIKSAALQTEAGQRLEQEAALIQKIQSPYLAPYQSSFKLDGYRHLVIGYISGPSLEERLHKFKKPLSVQEGLQLAKCLLSALEIIHTMGVLHRDVKPSNIIINEGDSLLWAVLIDFNLALNLMETKTTTEMHVGTAFYMSPEQSGLINRPLSPSTDLYSLGIVLYEAFTAERLLKGETVGEVLRQHLTAELPDLRTKLHGFPSSLNEIIQRLLQKDPRARYQSARAVFEDVETIERSLVQGVPGLRVTVGGFDQRTTLAEPAFSGRDLEVRKIEAEIQKASRGDGTLILLEGESGQGKTRLINEIAAKHSFVLRGQGVTETGQQPFQLFTGVIQSLILEISRRPKLGQMLMERLADHLDAISDVFPQLGHALGRKKEVTLGPENFGPIRSVQSLSALLNSIGSPSYPALVILDDCQWGDELSYQLLTQWEADRNAIRSKKCFTSIVVSFRNEEVSAEHSLRSLRGSLAMKLPPLQPADLRSLLESMAGQLPDSVVQVVNRLSEGNPFMASAVLQGLIESRALIAEPSLKKSGWQIDPIVLGEAQSSTRAGIFLSKRLHLFPPTVLSLLKVGAVLGKSFNVHLAAELAGIPDQEASRVIQEGKQRKVIWIDSAMQTCTFVHDKIRETLLQLLDEETRRLLHLRAATRIEETEPNRAFDLAYHFYSAGEVSRALPYAIEAAESARARYSLEVSEKYYRIAAQGVSESGTDTRKRIVQGLGEVLMLRGKYPEAVEKLTEAKSLATHSFDQAQILGKLGELAFKRGQVQEATTQTEAALKLLGRFTPKNSRLLSIMLLWEFLIQALHTFIPILILPRKNKRKAQVELLAIHLYSRLAYCYWFGSSRTACLWTHLKEINLAEHYPNTLELAQAYSEHGPCASLTGQFDRGITYVQRSFATRKSLGDLWGQGQSLHFLCQVLFSGARDEECIEKGQQAVRLLERTGDRWEANTGHWHIAFAYYRLGRLKEAVQVAKENYQVALELGDFSNAAISLGLWSLASRGEVPLELIDQMIEKTTGDFATLGVISQGKGLTLLKQGDSSAAVEFLTQAWNAISGKGILNAYVLGVVPWTMTALREEIERTPIYNHERRTHLVKTAKDLARKYIKSAKRYRNDLPHFLREKALLAAIEGNISRAHKLFEDSLRAAEVIDAKYEYALTEQAWGKTGELLGWPKAKERLMAAQISIFRLEGRSEELSLVESLQDTLSLQDRFSAILVAGRRIALALTLEEVYSAIHWTAMNLVRGEFFGLIEVQEQLSNGKFVFKTPENRLYSKEFSVTLADQAIESGKPVTYNETERKRASESLVIQGTQSTIYAPIFVHGKPKVIFFLGHGKLADLYGENEKQLAEFIAVLSGAAMENCKGVSLIQELSNERAKALHARDEFLSIASHELRTPLTSLRLQIELILNLMKDKKSGLAVDKKLERMLQIMDHQGVRLTRLIENLLDLTRIESGRLRLNLEKSDLKEIVALVIERFREDLAESNYTIEFHSEEGLIGNWDRFRIEQVVVNLLHNAVKYGRGKPISITLKREGNQVILTVEDQGVGIPQEYQNRIFEQYERVTTPMNVTGLGLGLYIVKQTVLAHGGTVRVESAPNQGSKFIVSLPALEQHKDTSAHAGREKSIKA